MYMAAVVPFLQYRTGQINHCRADYFKLGHALLLQSQCGKFAFAKN